MDQRKQAKRRGQPGLARVTVTDQVRDYLVVAISEGRLAPGSPVRELEIAELLGTSQTPVREALRELAALGLIETRRHVGARVRDMAEQDLVDSVPVRATLEGLAGRMAVPADEDSVRAVREAYDDLVSAARDGDPLVYAKASTEFHRTVVQAAGNDALERAWNSLGIEVMTIMATTGQDERLLESAHAHEAIVRAIESGDAARAEQVLRDHQDHYLPATKHVAESRPD
jgi:DNA-binding GntR family transcriptional regulator